MTRSLNGALLIKSSHDLSSLQGGQFLGCSREVIIQNCRSFVSDVRR